MKILITGGSGLIGTEISSQLLNKGHTVRHLSRSPKANNTEIEEFHWDPDTGDIDKMALQDLDAVINLAGAPLNKRWTPEYKSTILRSRVDSTRLIYNTIEKNNIPLKSFISASATGYYPNDFKKEFTESDPPGSGFLSMVCQKWEQEAQNFKNLNIRTVCCRVGIVLSEKGGALPEMSKPIRLGVGSPLGSGKQWMPWVHLNDIAGIFIHALENDDMNGVYNAVGPYNVTNEELSKKIAEVLRKPFIMPNVPKIALKLLLGEMAETALSSTKASSDKIRKAGYKYQFTDLGEAIRDLLQ